MTMNPTYKDLGSKKEEEQEDGEETKLPKMPPSSSSRQWSSSFKNPRIVRVSRSFGGKDRHSKVCTIKGLRDRRIRLSVPTAIQLYDLQERLNLSQPSKVIDWLLDATKQEIDQLPPLPIIPTDHFLHFNNPIPLIHHPSSSSSSYNNVSDFLSPNLFKNDQENGEQNLFPLNNNNQFSVPNMPYNPNYFPPNLSLSQFGGGFSFSNRTDEHDHHHQECSLPSSSSPRASSSLQINYMSTPTTTPNFPTYFAAPPSLENDDHFRLINNHLQNSSSTLHNLINSPMKAFSLDAEREDRDNNGS